MKLIKNKIYFFVSLAHVQSNFVHYLCRTIPCQRSQATFKCQVRSHRVTRTQSNAPIYIYMYIMPKIIRNLISLLLPSRFVPTSVDLQGQNASCKKKLHFSVSKQLTAFFTSRSAPLTITTTSLPHIPCPSHPSCNLPSTQVPPSSHVQQNSSFLVPSRPPT